MQLALMQPYVFPYIGYFQLIRAADKIVLYDDVSFIKQGWINRNRILLNGQDFLFTIPVKNISSHTLICDTAIDALKYDTWTKKFLATVDQAYRRAPFYETARAVVAAVLQQEYRTINELASASITATAGYIGLATVIETGSAKYQNQHLKGKDRVLDICRQENAHVYINPSGGQELYAKEDFRHHGIELRFIQPRPLCYPQGKNEFVPWLSIIDVLMFNSPEAVHGFTAAYDLV